MKLMYTTTPDEGCFEVSKGVFARPVHGSQAAKLRKQGWVDNERQLRQEEGRQEAEEVSTWQSMTVYEQAEAMGIATHDEDGKKVHHKTLKKLIEEAQADD